MATGGSLFSGMYLSSNSTIGSVLENSVFRGNLEDNTEDWKILQNKLKESFEKETPDNQVLLKDIKDNGIEDWCKGKYDSKINTLISGSETIKIKELTQKYCTLKIQDRIKKENLFDNIEENSDEFNNQQAQLLKVASNWEIKNDSIEDPEFSTYLDNNQGKKWIGVRDWCLKKYNTPYRGQKDEKMWKEVSENCKKDPDFLKRSQEAEGQEI